MECVDGLCRRSTQTNVHAAFGLKGRHIGTAVDPELRIGFAVTDGGVRPLPQFGEPERRQQRGIESLRRLDVAHRDGNVVDHEAPDVSLRRRGDSKYVTPGRSISPT